MKPTRILLLLVIAASLVLALGYFKLPNRNRPQQASEPDQLLLRFIEPMEGGTNTYVFTENRTLECKGSYDINVEKAIYKTSGCKESKIKLSGTELESKLRSFKALEWKDTSCENVNDGWGIDVEGVLDNDRFALEAWNPDACESADARKLHALLNSIGEKAPK